MSIPLNFIYLPKSGQMCLAGDSNLTPQAIEKGDVVIECEIEKLAEVRRLKQGDIVVDAGAFVGDTARIFAKKGAKVYAFEPQLDAFVCAAWNTRDSDVTVYNAAVGDGLEVFPCGECIKGNLGTRGVGIGGEKKSILIDNLSLSHLEFLKIDVEGFEPSVIRGAMKTIKKFRPVILAEIYPELMQKYAFKPSDVILPLTGLGYQYRCAIGDEKESRYDLIFSMP